MSKMKNCKVCGAEIAKSAKTCPKCGARNKKHGFIKFLLVVIIVVAVIGAVAGNDKNSDTAKKPSTTATTSDNGKKEEAVTEAKIEYTAYSVSELMNDLDGNAMKAKEKYEDQYVEITGTLSNIDASGKYIDLTPQDNEWAIIGVQCYIKTDEQKAVAMELSKKETVTVRGRITDVGEVMGYSLDIDEIVR